MDRSLDSLSAAFRPLAFEVLARLVERQCLVMISQTSRTMEEHRINVAKRTSRTELSKHLPRSLRGYAPTDADINKADAIDLAPWEVWQAHGPDKLSWDPKHPTFAVIGEVGERLGLRWGGRWLDPHDPGHLELLVPPPSLPATKSRRIA